MGWFFLFLILTPFFLLSRAKKKKGRFTREIEAKLKPLSLAESSKLPLSPDVAWNVVGESHYKTALQFIASQLDSEFAGQRYVKAELEPEPDNEHDKNAVKVLIAGQHVGYLAREDARKIKNTIQLWRKQGIPMYCKARITGGTPELPHLGVVLFLPERFPKPPA